MSSPALVVGETERQSPHQARNENMHAVIATGGKQYRVAPGEVIKVERLGSPKGTSVQFDNVLLVNRDGEVTVEPAALSSARVTGEVLAERKGAKVMVVKFKRRKNYRRHRGHRQTLTAVRITSIEV
jgi:large subunit ribosomal protein L21